MSLNKDHISGDKIEFVVQLALLTLLISEAKSSTQLRANFSPQIIIKLAIKF